MIISEVFRRWLGLDPIHCVTCEVLREQLANSERERRDLLTRLLDKDKIEPPSKSDDELQPIKPQFMPWRVRQQMLEAEDRQKAKLSKQKADEIEELEKELDINHASQ